MLTTNVAPSVTMQLSTISLALFSMLWFLFRWLIHSITGRLHLLLPFTYFAHPPLSFNPRQSNLESPLYLLLHPPSFETHIFQNILQSQYGDTNFTNTQQESSVCAADKMTMEGYAPGRVPSDGNAWAQPWRSRKSLFTGWARKEQSSQKTEYLQWCWTFCKSQHSLQ